MINNNKEEAIALDCLVYLDFIKILNEKTLKNKKIKMINILEQAERYRLYNGYKEFEENCLKKFQDYVENNPDIKKYVMTNLAVLDEEFSGERGLNAATFVKEPTEGAEKRKVVIAFRGTGEGEWDDNGIGLGGEDLNENGLTVQQEEAKMYANKVAKALNFSEEDIIIVTGHSKGGNKAQVVGVLSDFADKIDEVISVDGQGFCPEAIEKFKEELGEEEYKKRINKMHTIAAKSDYVNVLGIPIVPEEHTSYINAGVDSIVVVDGLVPKVLFLRNHYPDILLNEDGKLKEETDRGFWGNVLKNASDEIMASKNRDRMCKSIMMVFQKSKGEVVPKTIEGIEMPNKIKVGQDVAVLSFLVLKDALKEYDNTSKVREELEKVVYLVKQGIYNEFTENILNNPEFKDITIKINSAERQLMKDNIMDKADCRIINDIMRENIYVLLNDENKMKTYRESNDDQKREILMENLDDLAKDIIINTVIEKEVNKGEIKQTHEMTENIKICEKENGMYCVVKVEDGKRDIKQLTNDTTLEETKVNFERISKQMKDIEISTEKTLNKEKNIDDLKKILELKRALFIKQKTINSLEKTKNINNNLPTKEVGRRL